ncbi:MAG: hypothetical protein KAZ87_11600, partial [Spirochaetes bacterium]|nr:hypothetical protein [Spirochaetota bacterium]
MYKAIDDHDEKLINSFEKIFSYIHGVIILEFRKDDIFLSSSVLYELLYCEWKSNVNNFISKTIDSIFIYGLNSNCFIFFPLINFGLNQSGIKLFFMKDINVSFDSESAIFFPQTNNKDKTITNLTNIIKKFGAKKSSLNTSLIDHYLNTRPIDWFYKNPFVVLKIKSSFNEYYENEYIIIRLLEKEITKLVLLSMYQINKDIKTKTYDVSTKNINNFHTKDIKHYLFFHLSKGVYKPVCVPIHEDKGVFHDIMNTKINLNISKTKNVNKIKIIWKFIDDIYKTYLLKPKEENVLRFVERIISSLEFMRRSVSSSSNVDKWIYFGAALELLLSEDVRGQITETICLNGAFCVKINQEKIYNSLIQIYDFRSRAVHEGIGNEETIEAHYAVYIELLFSFSELFKSKKINPKEARPINSFIKKKIIQNQLTKWEKVKLSNKIA